VLKVVGVEVSDTLCDLRARHTTVQVEHLGSNLLQNIGARQNTHQLIIELVSSADKLKIVKEVSIDAWESNTSIVNLASENLITEEVVAENATVRVWKVDVLVAGHIGEVTQHAS
jgi:hypothetical protein